MNKKLSQPHVSIIILNWNGWSDTIECIESVLKLKYTNYSIILIDNNSTDDSVTKIKEWAEAGTPIKTKFKELVYPLINKPISLSEYDYTEKLNPAPEKTISKLFLVKSSENLGFARGCNLGMSIAKEVFNSKYYFLLNNDTVIDKNSVSVSVSYLENNLNIACAQSIIYYYDFASKIANAGGKILLWGQTKYYRKIKKNEIKPISFINGCAICIRANIINQYGRLTEKFFFGEEDFELSYRLKQKRIKSVCHTDSIVYHKIAVSSKSWLQKSERHLVLFAFNRIIDLRDYFPTLVWKIWKYFAYIYFLYLLIFRYKTGFRKSIYIIIQIKNNVDELTDVQKPTLDRLFREMQL